MTPPTKPPKNVEVLFNIAVQEPRFEDSEVGRLGLPVVSVLPVNATSVVLTSNPVLECISRELSLANKQGLSHIVYDSYLRDRSSLTAD